MDLQVLGLAVVVVVVFFFIFLGPCRAPGDFVFGYGCLVRPPTPLWGPCRAPQNLFEGFAGAQNLLGGPCRAPKPWAGCCSWCCCCCRLLVFWGLAGHQEVLFLVLDAGPQKLLGGALQAPKNCFGGPAGPQHLLWGPCRAPKPSFGSPPKSYLKGPYRPQPQKTTHQQHVLQPLKALAWAPESKTQRCSHPFRICAMFWF